MNIAHVVCVFPPHKAGMGNSTYNFVKILTDFGHKVTVFSADPAPDRTAICESREDVKNKFKVERIKSFIKFGNAAFLPQLAWKLKKFDLIHLHYPFYGAQEIILLRKLLFWKKTKLIIHYHMEPTAKGILGLAFKLSGLIITPMLMRSADIITCASLDYIKHSSIAKYYEKNKNKFREIFFGVDINKFRIKNYELRITNKDCKNILFIGGLDKAHYFKGIDALLRAVSQLSIINYQLSIVGDGDMRPRYEKIARDLGIADRVNFAGNVSDEDLSKYYQKCDVFVLPSINQGEAFGMVLLEAMACGKPVIASSLPGVRSVFEDGKQGLLVKPGDSGDLAKKIEIILSDNNLAKKMGEKGRKLVEKKYTWKKVGERLGRVYKVYKVESQKFIK